MQIDDNELNDEELLRYSRQILLDGWDIDAQERLKSSRVFIVGAGGLGCPAAETLARAGVGHIFIIDNDDIEASNLQRQTLFTHKDIGQYKAQVAKHALHKINPFIKVECSTERLNKDNADTILLQAQIIDSTRKHLSPRNQVTTDTNPENDTLKSNTSKINTLKINTLKINTPVNNTLLLDCSDNFSVRELLNELSVRYQLPLLSASAIAMTGQLALYEPYHGTGCYHCVFGDTIAPQPAAREENSRNDDSRYEDEPRNCSNSGVLASTTTVMGNLQANLALQYLGLKSNPLLGKLLIWNGSTMSQHLMRYRQDKKCPVCAAQA